MFAAAAVMTAAKLLTIICFTFWAQYSKNFSSMNF